jgi:hypothetical protein
MTTFNTVSKKMSRERMTKIRNGYILEEARAFAVVLIRAYPTSAHQLGQASSSVGTEGRRVRKRKGRRPHTVTRLDMIFRYPDRVPLTHFVHRSKKNFGIWA